MDDVEIVVAKCKPLVQAKALAILSTFLKNDQGKQPDEQVRFSVEWCASLCSWRRTARG